MAKSLIANVPNEPFTNFYENCFKLLLAYPQIKLISTDNGLMGSKKKDYMSCFFPNWKNLHIILDKENQNNRKKQLQNITNKEEDFFYITKTKKTELLSFIHHLRNAIAHGEIKVQNSFVEIKDYFYSKEDMKIENTPSAICRISCMNLQKFMSELVSVL